MSFRIIATDQPVLAKQFAALDACDKSCWVDDPFHAARFDTSTEARAFGEFWLGEHGWAVEPFA